MEFIDLHVHSNASDGTLSPTQVVRHALEAGLSAIALTDHDTVAGVEEALNAAKGTGLTVIPGTELSCDYEGKEIHILGLFLNHKHPELNKRLIELQTTRDQRNLAILERFQKNGFLIEMDDLTEGNPNTIITRAHFAKALLKKGYVSTMDKAFKKYLSPGCPYYVSRERISPEASIRLIADAGGLAVLAHPLQYKLGWKETERLITQLTAQGLAGVEVYYNSHTPGETTRLQEICRKLNLLPSGGSDFHGDNKPDIKLGTGRGNLRVSRLLLDDLVVRAKHLS